MNYDTTSIPDSYAAGRRLSDAKLRVWLEAISKDIEETPRTILDVGCGTGRFSKPLKEWFEASLIGVDPSRKMISQANGGGSMLFSLGDALQLPIKKGSIDLVFLSMVYHHLPDHRRALNEFKQVLKPAGCLCIRNSTKDELGRLPYLEYFPSARTLNEKKLPSVSEVAGIARACGFELRAHSVIEHEYAATPEEYENKISSRSLSDLASIEDQEFKSGLERLRADLKKPWEPVLVPIDLFLFSPSGTGA